MRLLFVTGSLVHGGAERHTITLANRLAERGHDCRAAYVKPVHDQLSRYRIAEVECLQARRYFDVSALRGLKNILQKAKPTAVIAANPYALMYARLAGRWARSRAPLAVVFHSTRVRNTREQLQMLAYRPLFWSAECAVFVCEAQRRHWRRRQVFGRTDRVIYNGVDTEHWRPWSAAESGRLRGALGFEPQDFVVGLSAVLRPEKNPVQLVEAVSMLRRRGVRARALFVGDGEMRGALEERARALGISGDVTVSGFQQDVRPFLAACNAVALTSTTEALSLAAIEAMALARPVVHSAVGGAAELIEPGRNGFVFPVGDTATLVGQLAHLARPGAWERMGRHAREAVETRFSERTMVDRYEQLLSGLEMGNAHDNVRTTARAY